MYNRICISLFLLLIGTIIYILFRQDVLFLMYFPSNLLSKIKVDIDYSSCSWITYFLIFCLPDALWYAALLIFQSGLYEKSFIAKSLFVFSVSLPFIYELMQKTGMVYGTFDWFDVFTYLLTFLIIVLCQRKLYCQF